MAVAPKQASITIAVTGPGAGTQGLQDELREALSAEIRPAPVMGGLAEVWRYAVEWGPQLLAFAVAAKPALEAVKLAAEIADKLLALIQRHPGITLTIPSRNGPIKVEGASREMVETLVAAELMRGADGTAG
ncbi:hypothetical protein OPKNFCMD_5714 [Methylobacterium crusticola]|uniref:Uncharacterized protein n=1 Tax=Methylobacterium crusticola TaxID=1697972 RepID=A0ABQ4R6J8_9HYPH|nr:hypothetical protein [Methylobacterium crusticola]GJD52946.1 hypothetical protein OPKNFCMD_5714 [Methylobacterium crusticola]